MYQFSRSIFRELAPLVEDKRRNHQRVLEACETTMVRLVTDRRYFARPTRALFTDVRGCFPISEQLRVYQTIDRNIKLALRYLETTPPEELMIEGVRECRAHTRKGTPCQREPLPGRDYCPSHKHLEELDVLATADGEPTASVAAGV